MKLLKLSLWLKGFPIYRAIKELNELNALSKDERKDELRRRRDKIVEYHYNNNPFYKQLVGEKLPEKFEDLPIMKKSHLQQDLSKIVSIPCRELKLFVNETSGSSGHPFYFAKDKMAHARTHALVFDRYKWHNLDVDSKQARFFGVPLSGTGKYKERIKDFLSNRVRFHVFDLSDEQLNRYMLRFKHIKFEYVYGYTSAQVMFAKYLIRQEVTLSKVCPTLRLCIVTSEVCTSEDKQTLEKAFGVKVVNEYGASELGVIAFTDKKDNWILSEENDYFEIVDDDYKPVRDGEVGRVLVTSLYNKALPMIRYENGDMGVMSLKKDKAILVQLSGRVDDVIILPSGRKAAGLTFYYVAKSFFEKSDVIKEFIIRQTHIDTFEFDIVSDREISKDEICLMQLKMDEYLEPNLKLIVNRVDKINRPNSGKIKHFYSELK